MPKRNSIWAAFHAVYPMPLCWVDAGPQQRQQLCPVSSGQFWCLQPSLWQWRLLYMCICLICPLCWYDSLFVVSWRWNLHYTRQGILPTLPCRDVAVGVARRIQLQSVYKGFVFFPGRVISAMYGMPCREVFHQHDCLF